MTLCEFCRAGKTISVYEVAKESVHCNSLKLDSTKVTKMPFMTIFMCFETTFRHFVDELKMCLIALKIDKKLKKINLKKNWEFFGNSGNFPKNSGFFPSFYFFTIFLGDRIDQKIGKIQTL